MVTLNIFNIIKELDDLDICCPSYIFPARYAVKLKQEG